MEELLAASELLKSALARYTAACYDATQLHRPYNEKQAESHTLMDSITRELRITAGYKAEVQTAESTLARCRNSFGKIVPINILPSELLAFIFSLLCSKEDCLTGNQDITFDQGDLKKNHLSPTHTISHVCSRWRQIMVDSRPLWSHIDITASSQRCAKLLARAKLYSKRATLVPLSLHISNPEASVMNSSDFLAKLISDTCSLLAPRTRQFRFDNLHEGREAFEDLLDFFLAHADQNVLRELRILDHAGSTSLGLLEPQDCPNNYHANRWRRFVPLWLSTPSLDALLLPLEVLWLKNIVFPWSCHVYVGLTDLRLIADRDISAWGWRFGYPNIHILNLVGVLSSCPRLRIFHCNIWLDIGDVQSGITPVPLNQLEVVNLHLMASSRSSQLLAYISPGEKRLDVSLSVSNNREHLPRCFFPALILDFFSRSHIRLLALHKDWMDYRDDEPIQVPIATLLSELPKNLHTLGLNRFDVYRGNEEPTSWPTRFCKLYLRSSMISIPTLKILVRVCALRELMFDHLPDQGTSEAEFKKEMEKSVPKVGASWHPPPRWKEK